ncbi:hypothetical protein JNB_11109 [Janibacter sp. HTCC2649]|uniref:alpha/beta hydrolase n=1 Tax=Janibacter sp. HTCC2649 TaxID=313589 RepID=UPI0000670B34|nr:alpha/beta hydrolase [Janibacter sp. HTCC2649]EAQ00719.1 hypothetical protein JNB_11109 [Janibacter sp. HTCC2649]
MTTLDHQVPEGLRTRGTVIVVPGRGESPTTYERFAARLAADAYRVRVVEAPLLDGEDPAPALAAFADQLEGDVDGVATTTDVVHPLVLVGADTGALAISALIGQERIGASWWPDAVVLAGVPGLRASTATTWEEQLDERTHCPVHRTRLTADQATLEHALARPLSPELVGSALTGDIDLPRLVLIGDVDPLADRDALIAAVGRLSRARLTVVRGAHHDVLNDLQHRSVAAEVVTFLEVLRNELEPVLAVESSAW